MENSQTFKLCDTWRQTKDLVAELLALNHSNAVGSVGRDLSGISEKNNQEVRSDIPGKLVEMIMRASVEPHSDNHP